MAVGQASSRADWLLGAGDAYAVVPGQVQRVQTAYYERREIDRLLTSQPTIEQWPDYIAEAMPSVSANVATYSGAELAVSLANAYQGSGRPTLVKALESAGLGKPGNVRADRLLKLGREQLDDLRGDGWDLCLPA